jgi:hypothetical protein
MEERSRWKDRSTRKTEAYIPADLSFDSILVKQVYI